MVRDLRRLKRSADFVRVMKTALEMDYQLEQPNGIRFFSYNGGKMFTRKQLKKAIEDNLAMIRRRLTG